MPFPLLPGRLLGLGVGGMIDGILLHEILQWHHMVSGWYPPTTLDNLRVNTVADGLFHTVPWLLIVAGVFTLWRAAQQVAPPSRRWLVGALLMGRGLFKRRRGSDRSPAVGGASRQRDGRSRHLAASRAWRG